MHQLLSGLVQNNIFSLGFKRLPIKHQNFQSKIVGVLPFSKLQLFNENTRVFMKTQYSTSV